MKIRSREELINYFNQGNQVKYVFFWGHQQPEEGISKTCFSQWYEASFKIDGILYRTAEHCMMAEKARLFGDQLSEDKILQSCTPGEAKKIGRSVQGFDESLWLENRFSIVIQANLGKFSQNMPLKEFLLGTNNRILVEASPVDRIWGIGLAADDKSAENPNLWKGENLLGFALMEVRSLLSEGVISKN